MGRRGLDHDTGVGWFDADQVLDLCEINHVGRRGQPLLHHRDQRMTAREVL